MAKSLNTTTTTNTTNTTNATSSTQPTVAGTRPLSHADTFGLVAILSALPWGVRVKSMTESLGNLTPEGIDAAVQTFRDYHEAVLAKLYRGGVTGAVLNCQNDIVMAIRSGESAIIKLAESVKARKAKTAKETQAANRAGLAQTPLDITISDRIGDLDPTKV